MIQGFSERIQEEIEVLAPLTTSPKVIASPERDLGAWMGGSILGMMPWFPQMTVTHEEYNERGARIAHRQCLYLNSRYTCTYDS